MVVGEEPDHSGLIKTENKKRKLTAKNAKWWVFFVFLVLSLIALIGIIIYTEVYISRHKFRIDCNPDLPLNYKKCLDRGCMWVQRSADEPPCFYPNGYGYEYTNIAETPNGYIVELKRKQGNHMFGNETEFVDLHVSFETSQRLRLKFLHRNKKRYEVTALQTPIAESVSPENTDYVIEFSNTPQFGIIIKRNKTGETIFDSNFPGMIHSDQFLQMTVKPPSLNIYGFGERTLEKYKLDMNMKRITLFARDQPPIIDGNLYGVHPFYMNVENSGNTHGVFLLNSNAMEIFLQPYPAVTFRTIGGILDFYVFLGPTPEDVVKQYTAVIGKPMMPPYWSLGFQISRYGYKNISEVEKVVKRNVENKIPHDVQYIDIDYMEDFKSFTIDRENFATLGKFTDDLHNQGKKLILILDPFISSNMTLKDPEKNYTALVKGLELDIFINMSGTILEGKCWPGNNYYPDFSHPNALEFWGNMCTDLRKEVKYDGLWIDMNEPSSFVDGSIDGCLLNSLNFPPYPAGVLGSKKDRRLFQKTICMDSDQKAGKHYDVHNLYGYFQAQVTHSALNTITNKRVMLLTRSTYAGSGRYAAHWLGDNLSTWEQLRSSIPGIMQFNTFGIPFVGADICGFSLNTTNELCSRWMQLGAFYPFSRNHNGFGSSDQDPGAMAKEVIDASRKALVTRYELLPYLYTLFHYAHTAGTTVVRPLLHEFPKDEYTRDIDFQFMWGPGLLISPIVYEGQTTVSAYFPEGNWYNFYTGKMLKEGERQTITLPDEGKVNLHVRGGHILPVQNPENSLNTEESRKQPMGLFVAPDDRGSASGSLFWDDGISSDTSEKYLLMKFEFTMVDNVATLSATVVFDGYQQQFPSAYFTICEQPSNPKTIEINDKKLDTSTWEYTEADKMLHLKTADVSVTTKFLLTINY